MALRVASIASNTAPHCPLSLDLQVLFPPLSCRMDLGVKVSTSGNIRSLSGSGIRATRSSNGRDGGLSIVTRAAEQTASATEVGGVTEVTQETFWPVMEAAGDKIVVLDLYTQWCGPCKIMLPKIVDLSRKYSDVLFLKLDCNQHNKALAKKLGVKVVPTFKLFRDRKEIAEVKGAKFDELVQTIEEARNSSS
ncbi:hypothetical protein KP509_02G053000 [Ceratopteris richardii]|uniref:Thioredoxin domain-containing protein n=1 Tax=Ceratopteris richardii TaxID=49495 RepID=A0A8T2V9H0_CERRI|nr:hypothetical protein KP509_02G053000 [Ceratopteris richardii]